MNFNEERQLESTYVMGTYARKPVELVRGRGMRVEDAEGRTYLDFVSGVGAVSLGHCHPALVEAVSARRRASSFTSATTTISSIAAKWRMPCPIC